MIEVNDVRIASADRTARERQSLSDCAVAAERHEEPQASIQPPVSFRSFRRSTQLATEGTTLDVAVWRNPLSLRRTAFQPEKGNSSERVGRKADGLTPCGDMAAWLPGECAIAVYTAHPRSGMGRRVAQRRALFARACAQRAHAAPIRSRPRSLLVVRLLRWHVAGISACRPVSSTTGGDDYGLRSVSYGLVDRRCRSRLLGLIADPKCVACCFGDPGVGRGATGTVGYTVVLRRIVRVPTRIARCRRHDHHPGQRFVEGTTYYFAVTAYDTAKQESVYSNEVSKTIPYPPPWSPSAEAPAAAPLRRR